MKKMLLMAFLAVGLTANAETMVTSSDDEIENEGGIDLGQGKDDNDRWSMHFSIGVDVPTGAPDGVEFAPFRSWEFNWTVFQYDYTPKNWNTTFSAGLGFNWRAYTLKGHDNGFVKVGDVVSVGQPAAVLDDFSSNIHTTSLSMPLLVKQKFSKSLSISVGAQLNWNYYARIHNFYEQGDHETDDYVKKIGERPFTVDVLGIVHFCKGFGIYCKYSPMSVLKKDRGPEFQSLAFGFYF
jgi:hypothetical protein